MTLMTSCYVIQSSKIVKINFFTLIPELDFQYSVIFFVIIKPKYVLALQIYKRLIPTIYTQKAISL